MDAEIKRKIRKKTCIKVPNVRSKPGYMFRHDSNEFPWKDIANVPNAYFHIRYA